MTFLLLNVLITLLIISSVHVFVHLKFIIENIFNYENFENKNENLIIKSIRNSKYTYNDVNRYFDDQI